MLASMFDRDAARQKLLRILVAVAVVLGAAAFLLGRLPGLDIYRGETYVETRPIVEQWNWFLGFLVGMLAPGFVVWRRPRLAYALLWSLWVVAFVAVVLVATFDLGNWDVRVVVLPAHAVFVRVMWSLLAHLIAIVPLACGVFWWVTRDRPAAPPLPTARVISR